MFLSTEVANETKATWIGLVGTQGGVFSWDDGSVFAFSYWLDGKYGSPSPFSEIFGGSQVALVKLTPGGGTQI